MQKAGLAHLYYHDVHWEYCYDYDARVDYIRNTKPKEEIPTRLKWFAIVPNELLPGKDSPEWAAYVQAKAVYVQTKVAYVQTCAAYQVWAVYEWAAYVQSKAVYEKAWAAYLAKYHDELDALHEKLFPGCPWNGKTMFPEKE